MIDRSQHAAELMAFDRQYRQAGLVVAGMDEVGRGPLAGNVVTACVVMPEDPLIIWIDDSKKLSESRREKVFDEIMANALMSAWVKSLRKRLTGSISWKLRGTPCAKPLLKYRPIYS